MVEGDPFETQRDVIGVMAPELADAGFEDVSEIGRGGFGVVYRCRQPLLDRTVAVKVLTADLDEENRARFFREQKAMGRLTGHPNIVNVLAVGVTDGGRPYLVMQYHARGSLDTVIRRQGPLSVEESLRLGVKMAGALETAHRLAIVHRDVKPANILYTDYGEPVLTDFGIAHMAGGFETATGVVTGSPAFTAPEVLSGGAPGVASDVYSLGATLFCALTGHAAFERRSGEQVIAQFLRITTQPVPDLREEGIPEEVSAAVGRAMSADPGERPTAAALGEELQQIQARYGDTVDTMAVSTRYGDARKDTGPVDLPSRTERSGTVPYQPTSSSFSGATGNLPAELTSFIGRNTEVTEARALLEQSRLLTLTGIGGVGKTRLALHVAADVRRAFTNGVWLVELGELQENSLVAEVVAAAVGMRNQSARPTPDSLVKFFDSKRLLLVLDNCEQVVEGVAALVEVLLRACPQLQILTTSREPVGVEGEAILRVPPLTVPDPGRSPSLQAMTRYDAVTLFTERAASAVPGFALTEDNRTAVAEICRRLDGLPLPIELAAARLRAMSTDQLLQRLTDRYALLTSGNRAAPTRQQTLRLSVDWSYELCTPVEQQVWGRVSVFAGSFEWDAAEDICGDDLAPEELLDAVAVLVDKSILIREDAGTVVRFRMLETLRDYGREKAEQSGEYTALRRKHREWYRKLALDTEAGWISSRQLDLIARLAREQANLRETLEFCLADENEPEAGLDIATALFLFWLTRGLINEARHWFDRILARSPARPTPDHVSGLYAASVLADIQGDLTAATALVEQGIGLAEQMTDPTARARIALADGLLAFYSGDLPRASERLEDALAESGERVGLALRIWILVLLGLAYACAAISHGPERSISRCTRSPNHAARRCTDRIHCWPWAWRSGSKVIATVRDGCCGERCT